MVARWAAAPVLLGFAFLWAAAGPAQAGTEEAPEVVDAEGDALTAFTDIGKAWITADDPDSFDIHLALGSAPPAPGAVPAGVVGLELSYYVLFIPHDPAGQPTNPLNEEYYFSFVAASAASGGTELWSYQYGHASVGPTGAGSTLYTADGEVGGAIEGNTIVWTVPRSLDWVGVPEGDAAGYSLRSLAAHTNVVPVAVLYGVLIPDDRAPDDGFGNDFLFPQQPTPSGPATIYADVPQGVVAHTWDAPHTQSYVFNCTRQAEELEMSHDLSVAAGTVHAAVTDPQGQVHLDETFSAEASGDVLLQGLPPGAWSIALDYDGFIGSLTLSLTPPQQAPDGGPAGGGEEEGGKQPEEGQEGGEEGAAAPAGLGSEPQETGEGEGDRTEEPAGKDKGAPAAAGPLLLAALAFLAVAARRRT